MSTAAIVMMVIAMLIIWGGLVAAIFNLRHHTGKDGEIEDAQEPPGYRDL